MDKIVGYEAKCKKCNKVHGQSNTPRVENMPAACSCGGDMTTIPIFEQDGRGRTYEMTLFCKETGIQLRSGATLSEEEMLKLKHQDLQKRLVVVLAEAFATIASDDKKLVQLLNNPR